MGLLTIGSGNNGLPPESIVGPSKSDATIAAKIPGMFWASVTSTDIFAWAIVERTYVTIAALFNSGASKSAVYFAPTVKKAGSSRRRTLFPKMLIELPSSGETTFWLYARCSS